MAGIYIHIPFCRQACHYCNFHFSTSLRYKNELVAALLKETADRKDYIQGDEVETIYFGGGTPSLLPAEDISSLANIFRNLFKITADAEWTLEANPDDITEEKLLQWKASGINRLSIGVQSFFEEDLAWMNRAHTASQAIHNLQLAREHFDNISIDLIYGTPQMTASKWESNIKQAINLQIPHLSCYALTVEPKTPLFKMIEEHRSPNTDPEKQSEQFMVLMHRLEAAGLEHYEISNFAKPGFRSRHNSSYWQGKKYLGLGPSAHSFDGVSRQWNVANNSRYIDAVNNSIMAYEKEILTSTQKINEHIMIALRTMEGIALDKFDDSARNQLKISSRKFIENGLLVEINNSLVLTKEGKLLADGIAASLFF